MQKCSIKVLFKVAKFEERIQTSDDIILEKLQLWLCERAAMKQDIKEEF
jgi:hypothetical protein